MCVQWDQGRPCVAPSHLANEVSDHDDKKNAQRRLQVLHMSMSNCFFTNSSFIANLENARHLHFYHDIAAHAKLKMWRRIGYVARSRDADVPRPKKNRFTHMKMYRGCCLAGICALVSIAMGFQSLDD